MRYFLKLENGGLWEEVDEYTFKNCLNALADDGKPRYTGGDYVIQNEDSSITASLDAAPLKDIAIFQRFFAVTASEVAGGFIKTPAVVKFRMRKNVVMRELKTGDMWTKKAA